VGVGAPASNVGDRVGRGVGCPAAMDGVIVGTGKIGGRVGALDGVMLGAVEGIA
jgi:hypothetical protein